MTAPGPAAPPPYPAIPGRTAPPPGSGGARPVPGAAAGARGGPAVRRAADRGRPRPALARARRRARSPCCSAAAGAARPSSAWSVSNVQAIEEQGRTVTDDYYQALVEQELRQGVRPALRRRAAARVPGGVRPAGRRRAGRSPRYRVGEVDPTTLTVPVDVTLSRRRPGDRSRSPSPPTSRPAAWRSAGSADPAPVFCWARGAGGRTVVPNRPFHPHLAPADRQPA